jgi:hypothetical protein
VEVSKDDDGLNDDGTPRLRSLYEALGGEVSYDDIKMGVLFGEE